MCQKECFVCYLLVSGGAEVWHSLLQMFIISCCTESNGFYPTTGRICLMQSERSAFSLWQHQDSGPARKHLRRQRLHPHGRRGQLYPVSAQKRTKTAGEVYICSIWQTLSSIDNHHWHCAIMYLSQNQINRKQKWHTLLTIWQDNYCKRLYMISWGLLILFKLFV